MNGEHQHGAAAHTPGDSVARAQLSQLFFATLDDPASAQAIASGVCYCCKTSVATGSDGSIFAAFSRWENPTRLEMDMHCSCQYLSSLALLRIRISVIGFPVHVVPG